MAKRLSVVLSQGQSSNPAKRQVEEEIVAGLLCESGIEVTVIPHLYDLKPDSSGMLALKSIKGDMLVCSWLFERAGHWILDRNGIAGHAGTTLLASEADEEDTEEFEEEQDKSRVIQQREIPSRRIYCLDLRISNKAADYIEEITRIRDELSVEVVSLGIGPSEQPPGPSSDQRARFETPTNTTSLAASGNGLDQVAGQQNGAATVNRIEDQAPRRWYPVIDYSRCTNCLECIDFCLFGVYGVDRIDTILVEQPDNCRKGCPACSRVCPENAIIFPQHKTPAIAGSAEVGASLKIDLSQLFGAPEDGKSAEQIAAQERDEQLLMAGREAVGWSAGMTKRQADKPQTSRDDLDDLVDQLDELDI